MKNIKILVQPLKSWNFEEKHKLENLWDFMKSGWKCNENCKLKKNFKFCHFYGISEKFVENYENWQKTKFMIQNFFSTNYFSCVNTTKFSLFCVYFDKSLVFDQNIGLLLAFIMTVTITKNEHCSRYFMGSCYCSSWYVFDLKRTDTLLGLRRPPSRFFNLGIELCIRPLVLSLSIVYWSNVRIDIGKDLTLWGVVSQIKTGISNISPISKF